MGAGLTRRITWLGHSTVLIELGGVRLLTDPVLRGRLLHMKRVAPSVDPARLAGLGAVLISHMHHDHFDVPSLRRLERAATQLVVPAGSGRRVGRRGFAKVIEVRAGDTADLGAARVLIVPAIHGGKRYPLGARTEALGYVIEAGGRRVYFAGDTDLFDGMAELGELDLALIPVWGWGPRLGPGHLDPERAAAALALLEPRLAVPIHWGTLFPRAHRDRNGRLTDPPHEFAAAAATVAPAVDVRILAPGDALDI
jgi:L-ascorbate metabolism protein UlaG (beta-lactamase superfamily)